MKNRNPLDVLRHHVSGAIERGEAEPVTEQRDFENANGAIIGVDDYVRDPLDGVLRRIVAIEAHGEDATLKLADGGVMGANELHDADVYLPSEVT